MMEAEVDKRTRQNRAIYKRVDEAFNSVGIKTQKERAKVCGVLQETVSKWKRGINAPTTANMLDISARTGYEVTWLFFEKGRKFCPPEDEVGDKINRLLAVADPEQREQIYRLARALLRGEDED